MSISRLMTRERELAECLNSAPRDRRRRAAAIACRAAVAVCLPDHPVALGALSLLTTADDSRADKESARAEGELQDAAYFDLSERREPRSQVDAGMAFARARTFFALSYALAAEFDEAIYEALVAVDDSSELLAELRFILGPST